VICAVLVVTTITSLIASRRQAALDEAKSAPKDSIDV
jgi:tellurite resistance protein TerC